MDTDSFGSCLRRAREKRQLSLKEVAGATKIPRATLELIEAGNLDELPADVFVRGFIRSYARTGRHRRGRAAARLRARAQRAARRRARALEHAGGAADRRARRRSARRLPNIPSGPIEDDSAMPRRGGLGLAVFVIILLLIATITLSLLLRRPPPSGEGLSDATSRAKTTETVPEQVLRASGEPFDRATI